MGGALNTLGQVAGVMYDPLNITGAGGIPGVNSGGKGLLGEVTGASAADRALQEQSQGAAQATNSITTAYNQGRSDLQPYQQAGGAALSSLAGNDFMKNYQQDPGYQFRLAEGERVIGAGAAARGMNNSGATLKALTRYGQDYASNEYDKAYGREYSRLSNLAGMGGNAASKQAEGAARYGSNIADIQTSMANASASKHTADGKRNSDLFNQGVSGIATFFSDERLKTDIKLISHEEIHEFRKHLKPYLFKYLSEDHGSGAWAGVMAQDLEKSKLGRTIVSENDKGEKQIDIKKAVSLLLALEAGV